MHGLLCELHKHLSEEKVDAAKGIDKTCLGTLELCSNLKKSQDEIARRVGALRPHVFEKTKSSVGLLCIRIHYSCLSERD